MYVTLPCHEGRRIITKHQQPSEERVLQKAPILNLFVER